MIKSPTQAQIAELKSRLSNLSKQEFAEFIAELVMCDDFTEGFVEVLLENEKASSILSKAFVLDSTTQGFNYWYSIYERLLLIRK